MEIKINNNITIWKKYNPAIELLNNNNYDFNDTEYLSFKILGINPTKIYICGTPYDVIHPMYVARKRNLEDKYYRLIYIQINYNSGEYYIGKVNRKSYKEIDRYNGSGLKFRAKYEKNPTHFVKYFIAACKTAKETEELEAEIVNEELLKDPFCLNLVCGGGGTSEHPTLGDKIEKQRKYMQQHPEQYQAMLHACKELYTSGNTHALEQRNKAIKETMNADYYREMTSKRIKNWKANHPKEYAIAREKSRLAIQSSEVKEKKRIGIDKWKQNHPEEYMQNMKKFREAAHTPDAEQKRSNSLKQWAKENPEQARINAHKRNSAMIENRRKPVGMYDLETNELIRVFSSINDAGRWLKENGYTNSVNPASSISAVCRNVPCTTGYGYRKKAFGFNWHYIDKK